MYLYRFRTYCETTPRDALAHYDQAQRSINIIYYIHAVLNTSRRLGQRDVITASQPIPRIIRARDHTQPERVANHWSYYALRAPIAHSYSYTSEVPKHSESIYTSEKGGGKGNTPGLKQDKHYKFTDLLAKCNYTGRRPLENKTKTAPIHARLDVRITGGCVTRRHHASQLQVPSDWGRVRRITRMLCSKQSDCYKDEV